MIKGLWHITYINSIQELFFYSSFCKVFRLQFLDIKKIANREIKKYFGIKNMSSEIIYFFNGKTFLNWKNIMYIQWSNNEVLAIVEDIGF